MNVEFTKTDLERMDYIFKDISYCLDNNLPVLFTNRQKADIRLLSEQVHKMIVNVIADEMKNNEGGEI